MVEGWVLALVLLFVLLFGVVIVFLMKIHTTLEIVVRAIPLGAPKVMERRPSPSENGTRPVSATVSGGRH